MPTILNPGRRIWHRYALPGTATVVLRAGWMSAGMLLLFLCIWHLRVAGAVPLAAAGTLGLFVALCLAYGSLCLRLVSSWFDNHAGVALQFLVGYFVFNSLLFVAALVTPFGMAANVAGLSLMAVIGLLALRRPAAVAVASAPVASWAPLMAIALVCIGATIWCGDAQARLEVQGNQNVFHVWVDTFIHVREISSFAYAHGLNTVQDIKQAGHQAPVYHFASYLAPALVVVLGGASAMHVYASFQLPLGILLTGLAAYCLMARLFGGWPGVAAVVAIVLFPDAYQQGFQHRYLSYNFLSQVNLGMLYGTACVALAWMFMLDGCRRGQFRGVLLAWAFLAVCLFYKAHLFVANSYVLLMFPIVFFPSLRRPWRIVLGITATCLFCAAVAYGQANPRVPVMRLDGSGIGTYVVDRLHDYDPGWMRTTFRRIFLQEQHGKAAQALYAAAMLLLSTFGFWLLAGPIALIAGCRTMPASTWWFPVIVVVNYLVMTLGLALDARNIGTPDELLNRPLVWAYFALAAWTAAAGYRFLVGAGLPQGTPAKGALVAGTLACTALTVLVAPDLQTFPQRFGYEHYVDFASVPACLVQAAGYLRGTSMPGDIVQDSAGDPRFVLTALSERQLYIGATAFGGANVEQETRLADVNQLEEIGEAGQLAQFFAARRIDWYLQYPDTPLAWPDAILQHPAFACGGFRLFHFAHAGPAPVSLAHRPAPVASRALY